jgi:SMC interacting uncharacterized protein involved in chromosome segregation
MTNKGITWDDLHDFVLHHNPHHKTQYEELLMKINELLQINQSITGQLNKAEAEIVARIAALQAAVDDLTAQLADQDLTPEQVASLEALQASAQALDDITPDPAPVENTAA